jgi:hypothetical protein
MKTKRFLSLAATLGLAITFTFSCSSGDDSDGGGGNNGSGGGSGLNLSDLPKQAYLVSWNGGNMDKEPYTGTSNIEFSNIPMGKIQDGKVSLDLPPKMENEYLWEFDKVVGGVVNYPKNLWALFLIDDLYVDIPDKRDCMIELVLKGGTHRGNGVLFYSSKSGEITGAGCEYKNGGGCGGVINFDLKNISEGWNLGYYYTIGDEDDKNASVSQNHTSDFSKVGGELEWQIQCDY